MTATVDPRGAADFEAVLRSRVPGYLPGWDPESPGAGSAVMAIAARLSAVVTDRLNRAPAKNQLAFLDMLGVSLLPAQAARAPVSFTLRPGLGDSRAPAKTQVGASVTGVDGPLIFETERDIALAAAKLVEVATVVPGADQWASHTDDFAAGRSFTLFDGLQPVAHELYLAHDVHFALHGHCEIQVQVELAASADRPIDTLWQYWDGQAWRSFAPFVLAAGAGDSDSVDGTAGWTRSGTVILRVDGAEAKRRVVNWVDSYWIRARCNTALTADRAARLPAIDRIAVASVIAPPIGTLRLLACTGIDSPPTPSFLPAHVLYVAPGAPLGISAEPTSARAGFAQMNVTPPADAYTDAKSLAGGYTTLGPVPTGKDGDYTLSVSIPGFTTATATVPMSNTTANWAIAVTDYTLVDRRPAQGISGGLPLDLTKPFYPFGASAQPGAACHLRIDDAMTKPGALVTMVLEKSDTGLIDSAATRFSATVDAQYFDGEQWQQLDVTGLKGDVFVDGGTLSFTVPPDVAACAVSGVDGYWVRFRITSGTYGQTREITVGDLTLNTREIIAPVVGAIRYAYYYRSPMQAPTACHTCNDFTWLDHSSSVSSRGRPIVPFTVVTDPTAAVYLGFDVPLPSDVLSVYLDVAEVPGREAGPALAWECLDEDQWVPMSVEDDTNSLALPGTVRISYPGVSPLPSRRGIQVAGDTIRCTDLSTAELLRAADIVTVGDDSGSELAVLAAVVEDTLTLAAPTAKNYPRVTVTRAGPARFGTPRSAWVRARLRADGDPSATGLGGVYPNTTWAANVATRSSEVLGTSDGNPGQTVAFSYQPVLPGERIEVLELSGARAAVEYNDLLDDVGAHGGSEADLRTVPDPGDGSVAQVWVRWTEQPNLYFSGPTDRHYTVERSGGVVQFGDDRHGRIPPTTVDGIRATSYRSGGGRVGNVAAGAVTQLLSGIPAGSVTNIRPAEGGADSETTAAVLTRGPASVAARRQALTAADYEVLAREASPAVAFARAMPATDPLGQPRPGYVRVIIMPDSAEPQPVPSFVLRREVEDFLRRRCPASMVGNVTVVAPDYQPVGVVAEIAPVDPDNAGPTVDAVRAAAAAFLHPLTGGPEGHGWALGRDVYLSDLANAIGGVAGVDHVRTLELLLDGTPHGQVVPVPPGRIVVAGELTIRLAGGE